MTRRSHGKLAGKFTLITGGTSGIGLATAELFAAEGARVAVTGSNEQTLAAARDHLGDRAEVWPSDAGAPNAVAELAARIEREWQRLDVMFLNAGVVHYATIANTSEQELDECLRVNFIGPFFMIKHVAPLLNRGGSIVVTTSMANQTGTPSLAAYSAAKAALRSLVRCAAAELAEAGIRVNAIRPGVIDTPIHAKHHMQAAVEDAAKQIPLRRVGHADDIARVALFLASDDSGYMTGEELAVDGGMTNT